MEVGGRSLSVVRRRLLGPPARPLRRSNHLTILVNLTR